METVSITSADQMLKDYDFEMFSKAGNNACRSLTTKLYKIIGGKYRITQEDLLGVIRESIKKIEDKYPEVYDTEPGYHIQELVNKKLQEVGYGFQVSRYEF
jgi:hypothetical protein